MELMITYESMATIRALIISFMLMCIPITLCRSAELEDYNYVTCIQNFNNSVVDPSQAFSGHQYWNSENPAEFFCSCGLSWYNNKSDMPMCSCKHFSWIYMPSQDKTVIYSIEVQGLRLSGEFPKGLNKCSQIMILNLSRNRFRGTIPLDICQQMPKLTYLDLSYNNFNGAIPADIGNCKHLSVLHLQHNRFSGSIPPEIEWLRHDLINLDLSSNLLSGDIPCSLTLNFNSSSFSHNPELSPNKSCKQKVWLIVLPTVIGVFLLSSLVLFLVTLRYRKSAARPTTNPSSQCNHLFYAFKSIFRALRHNDTYPNLVSSVKNFTLKLSEAELRLVTGNFSRRNVIGRGGSSTVYKGVLEDGRTIAIKKFHSNFSRTCRDQLGIKLSYNPAQNEDHLRYCNSKASAEKQFLKELDVLGKLRHRNLVRILGYYYNQQDSTMAIFLQYMSMGSLQKHLKHSSGLSAGRPILDWKARLKILVGVAEALAYLHKEYDNKRKVIHGDLKPANVLLDDDLEAHVADFGISQMITVDGDSRFIDNNNVGTYDCSLARPWSLGYTAPECLQQGILSTKSDVYSFGVLILEMVTGKRPNSAKFKDGQTLAGWVSETLHDVANHDINIVHKPNSCCSSTPSTSRVVPCNHNEVFTIDLLVKQYGILDLRALPSNIDSNNSNIDKRNLQVIGNHVMSLLRLGCTCASLNIIDRPHIHEILPFLCSLHDKANHP